MGGKSGAYNLHDIQGLQCYKVMLFTRKNVGSTYKRLINKPFKRKISRNIKVHTDDMFIKYKSLVQQLLDG